MIKKAFIALGIFLSLFWHITTLQASVNNVTLEKALAAMSPEMTADALSATFVRMTYEPQTLQAYSEKNEAKISRTTISELVVSSRGVRESLCDAREVRDGVKQYAFHYANNGERIQTYDSRNKRGVVKKSPQSERNRLSDIVSPYSQTRSVRFLSRGVPSIQSKLTKAAVTSESSGVVDGKRAIILEGEYTNSDPERYFRITILPDANYTVVELKEYDAKKRILTDMQAENVIPVSGGLYVPTKTHLLKYTYDDHEGSTVQLHKLNILEPKVVPVGGDTFSLTYPHDAKIYDITTDTNIGKLKGETNKDLDAKVFDIQSYEIPPEKTGKAIITRANKAYAKVHEHSEKCNHGAPMDRLEIPKQPLSIYWFTVPAACIVAAIAIILIKRQNRKRLIGVNSNATSQEMGKEGV